MYICIINYYVYKYIYKYTLHMMYKYTSYILYIIMYNYTHILYNYT